MDRDLFNPKDIKKLLNSYKKYFEPIGHRLLNQLQKEHPEHYKKSGASKKLVFPTYYEKGFSEFLETAITASLKKEEGRFHSFTVSVLPLENTEDQNKPKVDSQDFLFKKPLTFNVENLVKLSTALNNTDHNIKVKYDENLVAQIMGFGSNWNNSLMIESFDTGKLLFSVAYGLSRFSMAIIEGRKIKFLSGLSRKGALTSYDRYLIAIQRSSLLKKYKSGNAINEILGDYDRIMKSVRAHGHGGALFFISDNKWKKSVQNPIIFEPVNKYCEIKNLAVKRSEFWDNSRGDSEAFIQNRIVDNKIERAIDLLGQLTALDGATIITREFEILAFGAKLKPINSRKRPDEVIVNEPFEDSSEEIVKFEYIGGTRHQSAAQFIFDQRDSVAVIVSQDGRISVMFWDREFEKVRLCRHTEYYLM